MPAAAPAVASSWQVSSFSETRAQQILQQKPERYLRFNQHQLSRIYPSSYRVDSSNYNPQPFWNAGCQLGGCAGAVGAPSAPGLLSPTTLGTRTASCPPRVPGRVAVPGRGRAPRDPARVGELGGSCAGSA